MSHQAYPFLPGYQAALEASVYYIQTQAGCLRIGDQDRIAFLQRQTTNDLSSLSTERSVLTVLVSPTARILDVLRVCQVGDELIVLTLPGHGGDTSHYLKKRIFFMDKVRLEDESQRFVQVDLEGPLAGATLLSLGFSMTPGLDEVAMGETGGEAVIANGQRGLGDTGYRLLVPSIVWNEVEQKLAGAGAEQLSHESHHILRVEAGLPAAGAELTEEFTPLEAGLDYAVSGAKGCYTGQEVLARQTIHDKVTQHLVRLQLETPTQAGDRLWAGGKPVGMITSTAVSPRFGPIALGIVKRPHHEDGREITVGEVGQRAVVGGVI